jgi:dihydroneopterin aldolase
MRNSNSCAPPTFDSITSIATTYQKKTRTQQSRSRQAQHRKCSPDQLHLIQKEKTQQEAATTKEPQITTMPTPIKTSHELLIAAGQCPARVQVKNIQSTIQGPSDAWGRPNRPQPISISVTVCMKKSFGSTSTSDALASDTVHYGLLSKAILATLARLEAQRSGGMTLPLPDVLENIWIDLTGQDTFGVPVNDNKGPAFLKLEFVQSLEVMVHLPKATLQGDGVSLSGTAVFEGGKMSMRGMRLRVHDLRIPILIGVNANERCAKQGVVANVQVERFDDVLDSYCALEEVVVKAMTDSSFETIEALLADMALQITTHLAKKHKPPLDGQGWQLKIAVEKPIAVVLADAPCVELNINTNQVVISREVV